MREKIIIALDVEDITTARRYVKLLKNEVGFFKIGSQLFTAEGPDVVKMVKDEKVWKLVGGDENYDLINAMSGGILDSLKNINTPE